MKTATKIALSFLCLISILFCSACADFGAGVNETSFYDYFSGVYMLTHQGMFERDISTFNDPITFENSDVIANVMIELEYCYIAFKVADGYTLSVDEFAFFAYTNNGDATLVLDFFIADKIPTKISDMNGGYTYFPDVSLDDDDSHYDGDQYHPTTDENGSEETRENEIDESVFDKEAYAKAEFEIGSSWNSIHLEFPEEQTVRAGQYIVVRVQNNCNIEEDDINFIMHTDAVSFTFNYLMFSFSNVSSDT